MGAATVQNASEEEFADLARWYSLAGITQQSVESVQADVREFQEQRKAGVLGSGYGTSAEKSMDALLRVPMNDWKHARAYACSLRLGGETIGMLVLGMHPGIWSMSITDEVRMFATQQAHYRSGLGGVAALPPGVRQFFRNAVFSARMNVVAVDPVHQGNGYGTLLVRRAISLATSSETTLLFGQFDSRKTHLRAWYEKLGFVVQEPGQQLDVEKATGLKDAYLLPEKGETYFLKDSSPRPTGGLLKKVN
jgi:GNAT superfamily N-acetyltransferase